MKSHVSKGKGYTCSSGIYSKYSKQSSNKPTSQNPTGGIGAGTTAPLLTNNTTVDLPDQLDILADSKTEDEIRGASSNELAKYMAPAIQLNTWSHDQKTSEEDVVIDLSLLPEGTKPGDVAELRSGPRSPKFYFNIVPLPEELKKLNSSVEVSFTCV